MFFSPELNGLFQRSVWTPHGGQTEAVHPEPGHQVPEPRGRHGSHHGSEGGLPLSGAAGQPLRGDSQTARCLRHGQYVT